MLFEKMKLSGPKLVIFLAALGVLVWAGATWTSRLRAMNSSSSQMTGLDKWLVGTYLDLIRSADVDRPANNDPTPKRFVIEPGMSVQEIGQRLETQGLVTDGDLFRSYVRLNGLGEKIQAGAFSLRSNMSIKEIAIALQRAKINEVVVTIPEGKRLEEVAELLEKEVGVSGSQFMRMARLQDPNFVADYPFLKDLPSEASLEGYLFPDTYRLPENPTAQDVLLRMLDNFGEKASPLLDQAKQEGKNPREILTIASIVEKEAVIPDERPTIASVYLNRGKIGMKLDADPTTQYALGFDPQQNTWWRTLTLDDYKYVDPAGYNTYINPALPPGPVASPGLGSIQAVVQPATTNYYFFVACSGSGGSHQFSVTYEEHLTKYNACPK
jgi:UPF0755 protein